jgi:hypothetical protein
MTFVENKGSNRSMQGRRLEHQLAKGEWQEASHKGYISKGSLKRSLKNTKKEKVSMGKRCSNSAWTSKKQPYRMLSP